MGAVTRWPIRRLFGLALLVAAGMGALAAPALAQSYPSKRIRVVVAAATGSPGDIISRIVANELGHGEGWQLVVENIPGAMSTIGAAEALKHPPDGYTIVSQSTPGITAPALLSNVKVRLEVDFAPVVKLATAHHVLVVNPTLPAKSLRELASLLQSHPDKFTFSSGGFGTVAHLAGELFKQQTGARVAHVPYRAPSQAIGDLVNGTNHYQFITPLPVLGAIATGQLRALAVTAPQRMSALQDVPTVGEEGFPNLVVQEFVGWLVRTETPNDIVVRINEAINKALAKPRVLEAFANIAAEPAGGSPAAFGAFLKSEIVRWEKVIKATGIKIAQ